MRGVAHAVSASVPERHGQAVTGSKAMRPLLHLRMDNAVLLAPAHELTATDVAELRWLLARMVQADRATRSGRAQMEGVRAWMTHIESAPWWPGVYLLWQAGGFQRPVALFQLDAGSFLGLAPNWDGWLSCPAQHGAVRVTVIPPPVNRRRRGQQRWRM